MLSSPRKGPGGLWIQGKLVLGPAWEQAVDSFKKRERWSWAGREHSSGFGGVGSSPALGHIPFTFTP